MKGIQIGELLMEQGVLTPRQVEHILRVQKESHRPFGDLAERLYGISPQAVEDAWVQQYIRMTGTIDLDDQKFDEQCLRLLNRRQAWQFHMLPMNRSDENLNIAGQHLQTMGEIGYVALDVEGAASQRLLDGIRKVNGTIRARSVCG